MTQKLSDKVFSGYHFGISDEDPRRLVWDADEETSPWIAMRAPILALVVSELGITLHLADRSIFHLSAHLWHWNPGEDEAAARRNPLNWQLQLIHHVN